MKKFNRGNWYGKRQDFFGLAGLNPTFRKITPERMKIKIETGSVPVLFGRFRGNEFSRKKRPVYFPSSFISVTNSPMEYCPEAVGVPA